MEIIENIIGVPFYKTKDCLIFNMDCIEGMKKLADFQQVHDLEKEKEKEIFDTNEKIYLKRKRIDEKEILSNEFQLFDLTITSPPYNIGKEYEDILDQKTYLAWCEQWIKQIYLLTKSNGGFWLNLGFFPVPNIGQCVPISYLLWDKIPFFLIQEIVWNYGAGVSCSKRFSPRNEKFLWYIKNPTDYTFHLDEIRDTNVKYPNQKKNGKLRCNPKGKNPSDVWSIPKVTSGTNRSSKERTKHPAQFPLAVIDRIIKGCSNEGDIIFDPFMGSGTTAEAALRNNRKVIGFEIRKDYCELIKDRLSQNLIKDKKQPIKKKRKIVKIETTL